MDTSTNHSGVPAFDHIFSLPVESQARVWEWAGEMKRVEEERRDVRHKLDVAAKQKHTAQVAALLPLANKLNHWIRTLRKCINLEFQGCGVPLPYPEPNGQKVGIATKDFQVIAD